MARRAALVVLSCRLHQEHCTALPSMKPVLLLKWQNQHCCAAKCGICVLACGRRQEAEQSAAGEGSA